MVEIRNIINKETNLIEISQIYCDKKVVTSDCETWETNQRNSRGSEHWRWISGSKVLQNIEASAYQNWKNYSIIGLVTTVLDIIKIITSQDMVIYKMFTDC